MNAEDLSRFELGIERLDSVNADRILAESANDILKIRNNNFFPENLNSTTKMKLTLKNIDTGNLKIVTTKTPYAANNEWLSRGYDKPPYDPNFEVKVVQAGNEEFVRVYSYNEDGTSNRLGGWIMRKSDIKNLTPDQIANKYALPKKPTHICDVIINPEETLQTGIANSVEGWGNGGGQQFDTMGKRLPQSSFVNDRIIGGK